MIRQQDSVFLTSTEAAKLLHISLGTLKKLIAGGKIPTIRTPGGHYRINKQELLSSLYKSAKSQRGAS